MINFMADLETMGVGSNAAIVSLGCVRFDLDGEYSEFYRRVNLAKQGEGAEIDADTVLFWLRQSDAARKEICGSDSLPLLDVLYYLRDWIEVMFRREEVIMWGNGASFDNVILRNAYLRNGITPPWNWWNDRCYRTVKNQNPSVAFERSGVHHNALDDAKTQAAHLIRIYKARGERFE